MQFKHYVINQIDEDRGHLYVTFAFDDEGVEITKDKKFDYRVIVGYDTQEMRSVDVKYKDKDGHYRIKTVQQPVKVTKTRHMIDMSKPTEVEYYLKEWARAYLVGLAQEKELKQQVNETVKTMIGVKNTTSL